MTYFIKQHARNTKAILDPRTPAEAEIWYDQTSKKLRYGDGAFAGGYRVQRENVRVSLTPAQITAATNDYAPAGVEEAGLLILNLDATHDLTGLTGGADGREIWISVQSTSVGSVTIRNQNTSSSAVNRFLVGNGIDLVIIPNQVVPFRYDGALNRWVSFFSAVAAITAGSTPGVSDTLVNVLNTATGNAAGLAIALG